ncbi:MAG TPA: hypothetical protein VJU77_09000 [Chthoniobacterales bacterium]|nr:hypothetical protein [Chthoniobacterales bacterium]
MKRTQHFVSAFRRMPTLTLTCRVIALALLISSISNAQSPTPTAPNELASPEPDSPPETDWADVKRAVDDELAASRRAEIFYFVYRADEFREASKNVSIGEACRRLKESNHQLASGRINRLPLSMDLSSGDQQFYLSVGWHRPSPPGISLQISFTLTMKNKADPPEKTMYVEILDAKIPTYRKSYVYYSQLGRSPGRSFAVVFYVLHHIM